MAKNDKKWHKNFEEYMDMIVSHPNYNGLAINRKNDGGLSWIATAKSDIGKARIRWAEEKAKSFGLPLQAGVYAEVMRMVHPSKWKVCQICGEQMSIFYYYPSVNFLKQLFREFDATFSENDHIYNIWDNLLLMGIEERAVRSFFIQKFSLSQDYQQLSKTDILDACEVTCRRSGKKLLSPGAMSNFPDRFDGFHTYNRCCRSNEDKGRSKENLKSYTKDRRAYEYWSDGNLHAANMFMGSSFFTGVSADHIGPISLGFVHDPRYLRALPGSENSTKRDRLTYEDIKQILEIYDDTKVYPMSWYSSEIWDYIVANYEANTDQIGSSYRDVLKQNMFNYMYCLGNILRHTGEKGERFLEKHYIQTKSEYFNYTYEFDDQGRIISQVDRNFTGRNRYEMDRFTRIAFQAIHEYLEKENRHLDVNLTIEERKILKHLCEQILLDSESTLIQNMFESLIRMIQQRLIEQIK